MILGRTPMAKAGYWYMIDAEMRKRRERTGLDTLVVYAVNDVHLVSGFLSLGAVANALSAPPGEYAGNVKLKGIDGGPHKRWSMWFNSIIREKPYQGLTYL